jgi:2-dehydropantoate 2-reductase
VSFQNGVVKDDILRAVLGDRAVVGGVCYIASTLAEPGVVRQTGTMQKLVFGEYGGAATDRLRRFAQACADAGIDHVLSAEIERRLWEKFVFLVGLSACTTAMRAPIGALRGEPRARAFLRDVMDEVVQVARAEGVALAPDFAEDRLAFADQLPAAMTSSMHHDLDRGSRLELPWLSGDVVDRGRRLGVATPCNRAVADILAVHVAGRDGAS